MFKLHMNYQVLQRKTIPRDLVFFERESTSTYTTKKLVGMANYILNSYSHREKKMLTNKADKQI